jgi:hypothetical protein
MKRRRIIQPPPEYAQCSTLILFKTAVLSIIHAVFFAMDPSARQKEAAKEQSCGFSSDEKGDRRRKQ